MPKPGDFLWGRLRRLEREEERMREAVERLKACLARYACDCPDYKRHDCRRKPCGIHATELLDAIDDRQD